ncbi:MAG: PA14 domain-containing protein [Actinomycetota bacterium]
MRKHAYTTTLRIFIASLLALAVASAALPAVAQEPASRRIDPTEVPPLRSEEPGEAARVPSRPGTSRTASQEPPVRDPDAPVQEVVERRDAFTRVFRNEDGSLTVDAYTSPIHYSKGGSWVPIDNGVTEDRERAGWLRTRGNAWSVGFGPAEQGLEIQTSAGTIGMKPVAPGRTNSATARVTKAAKPTRAPHDAGDLRTNDAVPDSGAVTYDDVWPGVDLRYEVRGDGLKEDIVVASPQAPSEYAFDMEGATFSPDGLGGLELSGGIGELLRVPAPVVTGADGSDLTTDSRVRYRLDTPGEGADTRVTVALDVDWLASQPAKVFPMVVDPHFSYTNTAASSSWTFNTAGQSASGMVILGATGGAMARAAVRFSQYEPYLNQGYRVYYAGLAFIRTSGNTSGTTSMNVYEQGAQPTSFDQVGAGRPFIGSITDPPGSDLFVRSHLEMDRWVTQGLTNQWFGLRGTEAGETLRWYDVRLEMELWKPPPPSYVTNITNGQVLSTTTPTIQAQPSPSGECGGTVEMELQITTSPAPGSGFVFSMTDQQNSLDPTPDFPIPPGVLQDGVTYWAWVLTTCFVGGLHVPQTFPPLEYGRRFKVDLGLGDGGPSPTDEVGSVPGETSTPSEGAPGPSLLASKVTTNLVNGNMSVTVGSKTMRALSGDVGLSFTYNSRSASNNGLRAEFYNDENSSGEIDSGDVLVGERIDPTVSFDWGSGQLVAAHDPQRALARWTGFLTVPYSGTWQIGAISSAGLKASVGGTLRLDRWAPHAPEDAPVFGSSFSAAPGTPQPITVDWRNTGGTAVARVFLRDASAADTIYLLSPAWLTRTSKLLPHGWLLNTAAGQARWVGLEDRGASVRVFSSDGEAHEFASAATGSYTPPATAPNDLLVRSTDGRFVLRDGAGTTYTFRAEGTLESLVTATDDRSPAALTYGYSGSPARLRTITDPVAGGAINLRYGGDPECSGTPAAAAGMLCRIDFWDGTSTSLTYNSSGRFIRLTNPGGVIHDFAYDSSGRIISIRDPLVVDAIAAGVRADDATALTQITYNTPGGVSSIVQPSPTAGALRPTRRYTYNAVTRTGQVSVDGFSPTVGYAEKVAYDDRGRITERYDPAGLKTTYSWDSLDRLVATTDRASLKVTRLFDHASRVVKTYGPAPVSSFDANGLPRAGQTVPLETKGYDEGIAGLAAVYWTNADAAGGPALHDTGLGSGGSLDRDWGTSPPVNPGSGGWSARYSGYLDVAQAGDHAFRVESRGKVAKVWVDDALAVEQTPAEPASGWVQVTGQAVTLSQGMHRIRVDMVDTAGEAGLRALWKAPGAQDFAVIPGSALSPNYGLLTSMTDADGKVTATEYEDSSSGVGPHHGLATATVQDPGGLSLRTAITYESPGPGSYLRRVARTLPAGNRWTTENYGGTEGPIAAVCGVGSGVPQGGAPKRITGPDPDGSGPGSARFEESVFDAAGRKVGRRVGTVATIASAGWECESYDARGRMASQSWPAHGSSGARTVTHSYSIGGNPTVNAVTDSTWGSSSVKATVDLLGRTISYTDIWAKTTTTTFDRVGRVTSTVGPEGTVVQNYDAGNGRPTTTVANGNTVATPAYDSATGRLGSVVYGNGAGLVSRYDTLGRPDGIGIVDTSATWTGDLVTRSLAGRVVDQEVFDGQGFIDAGSGVPNYVYDGAGRLTEARLPGKTYTYGFGDASGCLAPGAGANTNRSSLTVTGTGGGTTTSCYNEADQLVSTSEIPASEISYDDHGNTTRLGPDSFDFDSADRHVRTETATHVTTYRRDPLDRIAERSEMARISHVGTTTKTAGATTIAINRPAATQAGDLMLASVTASALTAPSSISSSGWTVARTQTSGTVRTSVLWRYAGSSDPASWTFTIPSATTPNMTGALSSYRNVTSSTPIAVSASGSSTLATAHPLPDVATTADAQHVVHAVGLAANISGTAPSGVTERANVASGASLLVADRYQSRSGTPLSASATTVLPASSAAVTVALIPLASIARYGFAGHADSPRFITNSAGSLTDFAIGLVGNTTLAYSPSGTVYSHANVHGDTVTVTNLSGNRTWTGYSGPYGEQATTTPPNTNVSGTSWGWHGDQKRISDRGLVHMGARLFAPTHGRFLSVDPIEGGCANDYVYVFGDPINAADLAGTGLLDILKCGAKAVGKGLVAAGSAIKKALKGEPLELGATREPTATVVGSALIGIGARIFTIPAPHTKVVGGALVVVGGVVTGFGAKDEYGKCRREQN